MAKTKTFTGPVKRVFSVKQNQIKDVFESQGIDIGPEKQKNSIGRILRYVASVPWAMEPARFLDVVDVLRERAAGHYLSAEDAREYCGVTETRAAHRVDSRKGSAVAVIPLTGIIAHRIGMVENV